MFESGGDCQRQFAFDKHLRILPNNVVGHSQEKFFQLRIIKPLNLVQCEC